MYCKKCGAQVDSRDVFCSKCGFSLPKSEDGYTSYTQQPTPSSQQSTCDCPKEGYSDKNGLAVLLLALFLGYLGIHSFYTGRTLVGVIQLLTLGGCGIWVLIDIIMLVTGSYRDGEDKLVILR